MNLMMRKCPTDAKLQTRRFSCESLDEGKPRDDQSDGNDDASTVAQAERAGSRTTRRVAMRHSDLRRLNERHFCGGAFFFAGRTSQPPLPLQYLKETVDDNDRDRPTGERDRYVGSQLARRSTGTALASADSFSSAARSPQLRSRSPDTAAAAAAVNVAHLRLIEQ